MKFLSTLLFASIAVTPVIAQSHKNALHNYIRQNPKHYQALYGFMNQQSPAALMKTTGIKQRILATSGYDITSGANDITDSTHYYYNGNSYRGSSFDYNMMSYDYTYEPAGLPSFYAPSQFGTTSVPQPLALTDSTVYMDGTNNLLPYMKEYSSYVNNTQISDYKNYGFTGAGVADTAVRDILSYDAQNRVSSVLKTIWSGTNNSWDTSLRKTIYYNSQGVQTNDSLAIYSGGNWVTIGAFTYTRTNSNLTQIDYSVFNGSNWIVEQQYINTYTANNRLQTSTFSIDTGGTSLMPLFIDSFGYTNNSAFCTYWYSQLNAAYFGGPSMIVPGFTYEKHLNAQGLPDSTHIDIPLQSFSGAQHFTYNSSNNPISEKDILDNPADTSIVNYYYEDYNDLAVNNTPKITANIKVYPNPSTDILNIRWENFKAGIPVSIRIINAAGQTVHLESFGWRQTTESLSVGNLQAGVYWISIADNAGNMLFNQSIVKQ